MSKTQVKHIIYLLAGILLCLSLTQWIFIREMKSVKVDTIGKINAVMNHQLNSKLTIWGASTALLNFNPKLISDSLNITAFNMGIDGTNIDQYNGLLKEYISFSKNSEYIVIVIDIIESLEKRNKLYELHNWIHHIDNDNIYNCLSDIDYYTMFKARYIPFYSITLFDKHAFPYFIKEIKNPYDKYTFTNLGFEPDNTTKEYIGTTLPKINYDIQVCNKLKSSCSLAIKNKIKPIVVVTPCFYKALEKIENKNEFWELINSLKNEGIIVYDFLDSPFSHDSTNFRDNTHMNSVGADKLTNMFIQRFKKSSL